MKAAFNRAIYPAIIQAGESIGIREAASHGLLASASAAAAQTAPNRHFSTQIASSSQRSGLARLLAPAHALKHKYATSVYQFVDDVSKDGRYAKAMHGFTWKTKDPLLSQLMETYFPEAVQTFSITDENATKSPPSSSKVTIRNENSPSPPSHAVRASVSAGGFPALWVAYMQSLLYKEGVFPEKIAAPVYILPTDMVNSAAFGSSTQFHVSHASPMYTDPEFSTANILWKTLQRNFSKTTTNGRFDKRPHSPEVDNYMIGEIHPAAFFDPKVIQVGIGYLYHEWQYKLNKSLGKPTILNETIPLAIKSGNVMDNVAADLGQKILLRKNTLRVAYDKAETEEMRELQEHLKPYGITCRTVSDSEALASSGTIPKTGKYGSIWTVEGDGNVIPNIVDILVQGIRHNGGTVIEGIVSDIHYSEKDRRITGITTEGKDSRTRINTNHLFTSFGARASYVTEGRIANFKPVEPIISGTGYSAFLLVEGEIKQPIDSNNSHFTPLKTVTTENGKQLTLIKATSGGAIGSDSFNVDHAINNLFYATHIIFHDKKVDIIAAKSCSRPLNTQNSGRLTEVLPGFLAGSGYGGKGITDAAGIATGDALEKLTEGLIKPDVIKSFAEKYTMKAVRSTAPAR